MSTPARRLARALVTLALLLGLTPALGVAPAAASTCRTAAASTAHPAHIGGIALARRTPRAACRFAAAVPSPDIYNGGSPPLVDHHGQVMGTPTVTVTPIFWGASGAFDATYTQVIKQYLADVAHDSGTHTNVFSTVTQYGVAYSITAGTPIIDHNPYPVSGCTPDAGAIYADGSGYSLCLDDDQIQAEVTAVAPAEGLGQLYVMLLPRGVESCFIPSSDTTDTQQCTINPSPSTSAYCGYHGYVNSPALIYANLPFPIYKSPTGGTCTAEGLGGGIQSPSGNTDADVLLSTMSHEIAEAMTDPYFDAWHDDGMYGNENGDECAYLYDALSGSPGGYYNQTINGHHYLTQTEFSNAAYARDQAGSDACVRGAGTPAPAVTSVTPRSGSTSGGRTLTISGTTFTGATVVTIGGRPAPFTVQSRSSITATPPVHTAGTVDIVITTPGGVSATGTADRYRYGVASVSSMSPTANSTTAGHIVTLSGTGFTGATKVLFGSTAARFSVTSDSRITAITPAHAQATVNVIVVNGAGSSATSAGTRYLFLSAPRVTRVSPTGGSHRGGTTVTITGSNFLRVRAVHFGYTAASFTVNSSTRITVRTPVHATGSVNVLVFTPGGASAVSAADRYRFT